MEHPPGQITCGPQIKPCKFKKTEITPSIFYEHHTLRIEINYKKKTAKTNKQTKKPKKSRELRLWLSRLITQVVSVTMQVPPLGFTQWVKDPAFLCIVV